MILLAASVLCSAAPCRQEAAPQPPPAAATAVPARAARDGLQKGVAFLLRVQNEDGSWGHWRKPESEFWSNLESHRSWQAATTGLACMALLDTGVAPADEAGWRALRRGLDFLVQKAEVKRPSDWDTDNTWAYVYGLAALTQAAGDPRLAGAEHQELRGSLRAAGEKLLAKLWSYQTPSGGWAYYDFETLTLRPSWATSFQTAVAVLGILDAKRLGWPIDEERLRRAIAALQRCRLPSGAYTYSVELIPSPGGLEYIDQVKGSLSRIQACNLALYQAAQAGYPTGIGQAELRDGLRAFFRDHRFLDVARRRPIPHEAYYYNSGYFYFFGHYYAAQVIQTLPTEERAAFAPRLWHEILKTQEADGAMWDFYMNDYGKPYGVSYGVSALARTIPPAPLGSS